MIRTYLIEGPPLATSESIAEALGLLHCELLRVMQRLPINELQPFRARYSKVLVEHIDGSTEYMNVMDGCDVTADGLDLVLGAVEKTGLVPATLIQEVDARCREALLAAADL